MTISWYSIAISSTGENIFNGILSVNSDNNKILNFFYMNNNYTLEDILIPQTNDHDDFSADNKFINGMISDYGVLIKPVIGYINQRYNNPLRLSIASSTWNGITKHYIFAYKPDNILIPSVNDWIEENNTQYNFIVASISSPFPPNSPYNFIQEKIAWYSITISLQTVGTVIFNGLLETESGTGIKIIKHFYYKNNNNYVDILIPPTGNINYDYGSDNIFTNIFSYAGIGGTLIQPVIGYININNNNPHILQLTTDSFGRLKIYYKPSNLLINDWKDTINNFFNSTVTSISSPFEKKTPIYRNSFFTNNSLVFYKPHNLSTGGGGSGVNNSRVKQRRT